MKRNLRTWIITIAAISSLMSCAKNDTRDANKGALGPVANGTSDAGGGGNGIDNKTLELYAVRIDTMPEYKRYIEPVIRRIGRGRGDIITAYMNWTIQQKPWYLIPRPLTDLSQEQVGAAFPTEQLALHSDERVYLAKAAYEQMNQKERASLLMHEIVMGARLLMKKTPKEQCEKLSGSQIEACNDPEMMKLAEAQDISDSQRGVMDPHDHDAVRAMTIFLMQRTTEVNADSVGEKRLQLGFIFPWDKAVSKLTLADVTLAMRTAAVAGVVFKSASNVECKFDAVASGDDGLLLDSRAGEVRASPLRASSDSFDARGVLDPNDQKHVVDLVRLRPSISDQEAWSRATQSLEPLSEYEVWISREEIPRVVQFRVRDLSVMLKSNVDSKNVTSDDWIFVEAANSKYKCVAQPTTF